ncbi:MAG: carbonic anhydrase [Alphaproteobacteria bacterium]|nr:carbonic anhydrase [Alphaproteobacteria bacterium]
MSTDLYKQIFENNRKWVESKLSQDEAFFERLAKEQTPEFLYIGCSDSRVPANVIMGVEPGDVFVHRNVANLVVNTDINAQSVIQYAVEHLHVKHVVVCGHYGCGGIMAAMQPADLGLMNGWLREVRDVYRQHHEALDVLNDEARYRRLVELNVQEQCINIIKTACVQRHWLKHSYPTVHGWVYDLRNGLLKDLELNFAGIMKRIQEIYRLEA